jgi:hypothetical protein
VWVWEPVREVALEAVQVRSDGAVADVAVGSDKGSAPSAPHPAARTPARRRLEGAGRGLAGQVLYGGSVRTAVSWPVSQASGRPQSSRCQWMAVDGSRARGTEIRRSVAI